MNNHAGQWALPGGSIDPGESPVQVAFRELDEEVGLPLPAHRLLGCLDDFREVALCGQATRVAHFEQPFFAWS